MEVAGRRAWLVPLGFGFAAQAAQIVLAREFLTVFHGNELSVALLFGLWLFWVAVGAACGGLLARRVAPLRLAFAAGFAQLLLLPAAIFAARDLRSWFDVAAGQYLPLGSLLLAACALLGIPCLVFGAQFAWAVRIVGRSGRTYALEALGAAIGSAAVSLLTGALNPFALAAATGGVLFGALAWLRPRVACAGLVPALALGLASAKLDRRGHERYWRHLGAGFRLVETIDSRHGAVGVIARGDEYSVYRSGRLWATLPERGENAPAACVILAQHPAPRRVFLAGGSAALLPEILRNGVAEVEVVEADGRLYDLVRRYDSGAIDDGRVRKSSGDGRRALKSSGRHDVVIVDAGEPDTALANRFYTREFFAEAREHLSPGGVFAVGPLAASDYAAPEVLARNSGIYRTLSSVFRQVRVMPGAWLLATDDGSLTLDETEVAMRAETRGRGDVNVWAPTQRFHVEKAQAEFSTGRAYDPLADALPPPVPAETNTDARPAAYFASLRVWAWHSGDRTGRLLGLAAGVPLWAIVLVFSAPAAVGRRIVGMFYVGFAGMAASLGALMAFHAAVGYLHSALGLLVAAFMLGGAGGALLKLPARAALGAVAAVGAALALLPGGLWTAALLPVAGAAVGAAYRALSESGSASGLYASDVAGGCLAALLAVPLLVPLHGALATGLLTAVPCAVAAAALRRTVSA